MGEERSLAHMLESLQQMGVDPSKFTMGQLEEVARVADEIEDPAKMKPEDFERIAAILEQKKKTPPPKKKVGRNERCPCGSGKKYKKCCL